MNIISHHQSGFVAEQQGAVRQLLPRDLPVMPPLPAAAENFLQLLTHGPTLMSSLRKQVRNPMEMRDEAREKQLNGNGNNGAAGDHTPSSTLADNSARNNSRLKFSLCSSTYVETILDFLHTWLI